MDDRGVISVNLAVALRAAGVTWQPAPGDHFVIPDRDLDDQTFVLSDMIVQVYELPRTTVIGFNGTTEWALDSLEHRQVVWMPRESQLRELLDERFLRLEAVTGGFAVVIVGADDEGEHREVDGDAESAYARALLAVLAVAQ